jgi:hypothetical protein
MNTAREIVQEIIGAGGHLWFDGDRVRGRNIPRRLAVLVKADEGGILAALLSAPPPDDYAIEERLAIQSEDDLPPDRGFDDVPGFEGMPDLTPAQHGAILHRIMYPAQEPPAPAKSTTDAIPSPTMQPAPAMGRPEQVTCGSCVRFQPGTTKMGIGVCLATTNGLPPVGNSGDYRAAFPMAPRRCPEYAGSPS